MSTGPVEQILFRTAIAAVNSTSHLRVYTQDVTGSIRESLYEGKWANGTAQNVIAQAKLGSPIAATSKELNNIRVYYVSTDNKLKESCYDSGKGWYDGDLNNKNFVVAPYSKVAASFLAAGSGLVLRVYAQLPDNTIQEFGYDNGSSGWQKMTNLGPALTGSEIASTSYKTSQLSIRVYFQATNLNLVEQCYDGSNWYKGAFSVPNAIPRTSLAATSFAATSNSISLRVYYGAPNDRILEQAYDGSKGWYTGGFSQPSIPGSEVAVINWGSGSGLNLRVYFENGTDVTGVSEWVWNGSWTAGVAAIPPA